MRRVVDPTALRGNDWLRFSRPDANDDNPLYTMRSGVMQLFLRSAWAGPVCLGSRASGRGERAGKKAIAKTASLRPTERGPRVSSARICGVVQQSRYNRERFNLRRAHRGTA